jgi:hypothetical protein
MALGEQHTSGRDIIGRERPDKGARHDRTLPTAGSSGTSVTRLLSHAAHGGAEPRLAERSWRYLPRTVFTWLAGGKFTLTGWLMLVTSMFMVICCEAPCSTTMSFLG